MIVVGVLTAATAALCFESGYVLQTLEARAAPERRGRPGMLLGRLAVRPRWLAGTVLNGAGIALQAVALFFAPLTVVQPTLALGMPVLLVMTRRLLGERTGRVGYAGALVIAAGVTTIALSAPARTTHERHAIGSVIVLGALALLTVAPHAWGRSPRLGVAGAACGDALAAIALKLVTNAIEDGRLLVAALWGAAAAAAGLLALGAEMSALRRLRASRVAPIVIGGQVVLPVLAAPIVVGESWSGTPLGGVVLAAGIALVASGVLLLAGAGPVERQFRRLVQEIEDDVGRVRQARE